MSEPRFPESTRIEPRFPDIPKPELRIPQRSEPRAEIQRQEMPSMPEPRFAEAPRPEQRFAEPRPPEARFQGPKPPEAKRGRRKEPESDIPRIEEAAPAPQPAPVFDKEGLVKELEGMSNTLKARFYNGSLIRVSEVPVRDVIKTLGESKDIHAIVFDGIITQRLADLASKQGVKVLVGLKIGNVNKVPDNIEILTKNK